MKKIQMIFLLFVLCACNPGVFYPYTGSDVKIQGEGGLLEGIVPVTSWKNGGLGGRMITEYDEYVELWAIGLPENTTCSLIGYANGFSHEKVADIISAWGGNTGTQSQYSFSSKFDKGSGVLHSQSFAGDFTTNIGNQTVTTRGYNVFYCEENVK